MASNSKPVRDCGPIRLIAAAHSSSSATGSCSCHFCKNSAFYNRLSKMYVDRTVDNVLISLDHVMQRSFVEQEPLTFPALVLLSFIIIIFFSKMVF